MTIDNTEIASRLREKNFRRFEPFLAKVLADFPKVQTFTKTHFDLLKIGRTTFAARFRDAKQSLREFTWDVPATLAESFREFGDKVVIVETRDGKVLAGSRESLKSNDVLKTVVNFEELQSTFLPQDSTNFKLELLTIQEVNLLCILAHNRVLSRPLTFTCSTLSNVQILIDSYDISLEKQPDGSFVLI